MSDATTQPSRLQNTPPVPSPMDRGRAAALITGDIAFCATWRRRLIGYAAIKNLLPK